MNFATNALALQLTRIHDSHTPPCRQPDGAVGCQVPHLLIVNCDDNDLEWGQWTSRINSQPRQNNNQRFFLLVNSRPSRPRGMIEVHFVVSQYLTLVITQQHGLSLSG